MRARESGEASVFTALLSSFRISPSPSARSKKFKAKSKQASKKERGLGEGIFARPPRRLGWESVSAIPASAGRQNRKIFVSLIEKNFGDAQLKNVKKIFLFCSPSGERKRWAGLSPCGRQLKISVRILDEISSDFNQKVPPIYNFSVFEGCCLAPPEAGRGNYRPKSEF